MTHTLPINKCSTLVKSKHFHTSISRNWEGYNEKTHRIWMWGGALSSNPMSFSIVSLPISRYIEFTPHRALRKCCTYWEHDTGVWAGDDLHPKAWVSQHGHSLGTLYTAQACGLGRFHTRAASLFTLPDPLISTCTSIRPIGVDFSGSSLRLWFNGGRVLRLRRS